MGRLVLSVQVSTLAWLEELGAAHCDAVDAEVCVILVSRRLGAVFLALIVLWEFDVGDQQRYRALVFVVGLLN